MCAPFRVHRPPEFYFQVKRPLSGMPVLTFAENGLQTPGVKSVINDLLEHHVFATRMDAVSVLDFR